MVRPIMLLNSKQIRSVVSTHHLLKNAKKIGKGFFSGVYQGDNENTILKLSFCGVSYDFLKNKSENPHFPKLINDFGEVGVYTAGQGRKSDNFVKIVEMNVPLYLYEVEKLHKLNPDNRRFADKLCKTFYKYWREFSEENKHKKHEELTENIFEHCLERLINETNVLDGKEQLKQALVEMCEHYKKDTLIMDMSLQNFMQRNDGTLVFTDPFCDKLIVDSVYQSPNKADN